MRQKYMNKGDKIMCGDEVFFIAPETGTYQFTSTGAKKVNNSLEYWTVDQWLNCRFVTSLEEYSDYPNAKKAAELKKTKLYKALK